MKARRRIRAVRLRPEPHTENHEIRWRRKVFGVPNYQEFDPW